MKAAQRTPARIRALRCLGDGALTAEHFARRMWPASARWDERAMNKPASLGGGMGRAAAGYLGKLRRIGLVERAGSLYKLSDAGREAIDEYERERLIGDG